MAYCLCTVSSEEGGLASEVASDLENEAKLMEEYSTWCDEEANTKEDAITSSKRTIGDLKATIEDSKARRMESSNSLDDHARMAH